MNGNKKIAIFLVVGLIIGFVAGFLFGGENFWSQTSLPQNTASETKENKASIMLDFGGGDVKSYNDVDLTQGENLFDVLKRMTEERGLTFEYKEYKDLGMLITKIGDKENGTENKYWQYWVNNKKSGVGASSYFPQSGDIIEWKFIPYPVVDPR